MARSGLAASWQRGLQKRKGPRGYCLRRHEGEHASGGALGRAQPEPGERVGAARTPLQISVAMRVLRALPLQSAARAALDGIVSRRLVGARRCGRRRDRGAPQK